MTVDTEHAMETPAESAKDPAKLSDEQLYLWLKDLFSSDAEHCRPWHEKAKEDFKFRASHQYTEKELEDMKAVNAGPPIVFNLSHSVISAVAGIEINQRHEVVYLPRGTDEGQIKVNETLTGTSQWMGYECDAEDEESEAFEEALDCGMGCTESRMDYEQDADGMYIEEKVPIREMYWDKRARKKNLVDAKRVYRAREMPLYEAREWAAAQGIEAEDAELDCKWAAADGSNKTPQDVDARRAKLERTDSDINVRAVVTILHVQWVQYEPYYRMVVTGMNEEHELTEPEFKHVMKGLKKSGHDKDVQWVRQRRACRYEAFLGGSVLLKRKLAKRTRMPDGSSKTAEPDGFTYTFLTGFMDKSTGYFYGLVSLLRDPQRLVNKTLQKMIHILATTAQGGVIAEQGAFGADQREAERTYAHYDAITYASQGSISGGKIMAKPGGGNISPYSSLLEMAIESIWRTVGLNPEIMGMTNQEQSGVLEQQRKQAAMTILAKLFDSLRRFRKNVGKLRLYYMQNFISDGRIVRIMGDDGWKSVKFIRDKTLGTFDVIVDDAPTSTNQKELTFSILYQLMQMPVLQEKLDAETLLLVLEYSPLPSKVVDRFRTKFSQPPSPEEQDAKQLQRAGVIAKISHDQAGAKKDSTAADKNAAEAEAIRADPQSHSVAILTGLANAVEAGQKARTATNIAAAAQHKARHEHVRASITAAKGIQNLLANQEQAPGTANKALNAGRALASLPAPHEPPVAPVSNTIPQ